MNRQPRKSTIRPSRGEQKVRVRSSRTVDAEQSGSRSSRSGTPHLSLSSGFSFEGEIMRIRFNNIAAAALAGLLGLVTVALLTPTEARAAAITLRACNNTRHTVLVASSYIPVGGSEWR